MATPRDDEGLLSFGAGVAAALLHPRPRDLVVMGDDDTVTQLKNE